MTRTMRCSLLAATSLLAAVSAAPAQTPALAATPPAKSAAATASAAGATRDSTDVTFHRETYSYGSEGRRDPFVSLMATGELRPVIADLRLVGVAFDPLGRNSVAIMRDLTTKEQYRVRAGQALGRMRVARIQPKHVVFTIEEFGFSRQEVLALGDSSQARTQ